MQRLDEPRHGVHRDAGAEDGHHGERAGVERAGLFVEAQAQKLRHRARLRAVVERHHEDAHKDHGRDGADAVEVRGLKAVLGARSAHADHFLRAQVGADEGQAADPGGQRAAGLEEVLARLHVALEGKADAQHKDEVQQHDQPIDRGEFQDCSLNRGSCTSESCRRDIDWTQEYRNHFTQRSWSRPAKFENVFRTVASCSEPRTHQRSLH